MVSGTMTILTGTFKHLNEKQKEKKIRTRKMRGGRRVDFIFLQREETKKKKTKNVKKK